ncbi:Tat pathway signal sequence domain protein [Dactylosporangium sp. NPDC006015]|uniref:Tat pathway signal sequence domain protein n=1 Tax=Dactylosporangium sp. NPDC006015 TaxID=3154576 RepID=UPI0033BADA18
MRKLWTLSAAALTAVLTAGLLPAAAHAATVNVLTTVSVGGPNVANGDAVSAPLKTGTTATFYSTPGSSSFITCTVSNFGATVTSNVPAPGTAGESLTLQNFSSCTPTGIPTVTAVQSIVVNNLPYATTVTSPPSNQVKVTGTATLPIQTTMKLTSGLGTITCVYRADLNQVVGVANNVGQSITFTNQKFNRFSGPSACFPNGYFSAAYGPVKDTTVAGSPLVFVN